MRILVIEDDATLADAIREALEREAYAVDVAGDGAEADELVSVNTYDLMVLDWTLPRGASGLDLLRGWRREGLETPVLMLTGRRAVEDRVDGLDGGADDYLTKPFAFDELLARARSLLRRRAQKISVLKAADVELDRGKRLATVGGEPIELTAKELGILEYLMTRLDETVTRTELAEHVWDDSFDAMSNVIDVLIYRLRKKLDGGREGRLLETVKGVGYRLKSRR